MDLDGFKCRMCGACCRIKDGIVRVSDAEVARIAAFLGLGEAEFIERETLIAPDRIVCDYAGFRTLDTVVRAKKVFGLDSFIIVSQPDHVRRAVFTARGFGCDAYGYAAKDVNGRYSIKTTIREQLAKIAAVLDVILRRSPKFLGPREALPDVLKESGSSS